MGVRIKPSGPVKLQSKGMPKVSSGESKLTPRTTMKCGGKAKKKK